MACELEDLNPSEIIFGCTDPLASNYNGDATVDDDSCLYSTLILSGCTDPLAINYNSDATTDDNSCLYEECPTEFEIRPSDGAIFYTEILSTKGTGPSVNTPPVSVPLSENCCTETIVGQSVIWNGDFCVINSKNDCPEPLAISIDGVVLGNTGVPVNETCCNNLNYATWNPDYELDTSKSPGACITNNFITEECNLDISDLTFNTDGSIVITPGKPDVSYITEHIKIPGNQVINVQEIFENLNLPTVNNTTINDLSEVCCEELSNGLWSYVNGRCWWRAPKLPTSVSIGVSETDIVVTDSECTTLRVCLSFFLERPDSVECQPTNDVTASLGVYSGDVNTNILATSQVSTFSLNQDGYCQWTQLCMDVQGFENTPFKIKLNLNGILDCCNYNIYLDDISVSCTIQDSIEVSTKNDCPGFTLHRVIDNKKSWVYNDGNSLNRVFAPSPDADIPWRYTNYFEQSGVYENHSKLVLNSKEMFLTFNMCSYSSCETQLNVFELIDYKKNFQNFWIKFIEQFIPATTIFVSGEKWCTREDQICDVIPVCDYDNGFSLTDLGIHKSDGTTTKPTNNKGESNSIPVGDSTVNTQGDTTGDYGDNRTDEPIIIDGLVAVLIKEDPSTLLDTELTLPPDVVVLLNEGMDTYRGKMKEPKTKMVS